MLVYRKGILSLCEVWYDEPPVAAGVDLIRYRQRAQPLAAGAWSEFHTVHIDLRRDQEALLAGFKKKTRNEVRRAMKEGVACELASRPAVATVTEFCRFFDRFAKQKRLPAIPRAKMGAYRRQQSLVLSRASLSGVSLAWHAYYRGGRHARLLFSASHFRTPGEGTSRQLIGWANRCLHWQDMLALKRSGVEVYDLGGWYEGDQDLAKLRINEFKSGFGGERVLQYNGSRALSIKGRLALVAIRRLGWV